MAGLRKPLDSPHTRPSLISLHLWSCGAFGRGCCSFQSAAVPSPGLRCLISPFCVRENHFLRLRDEDDDERNFTWDLQIRLLWYHTNLVFRVLALTQSYPNQPLEGTQSKLSGSCPGTSGRACLWLSPRTLLVSAPVNDPEVYVPWERHAECLPQEDGNPHFHDRLVIMS